MTPEEFYRLVPRDRLLQAVRATPSPCYLFFEPIVGRQVARVREGLGERFELHYAIKANPDPAILRALQRRGVGADVASGGELAAALAAGFAADLIEFSGPGKTAPELASAIDAGIGAINVESLGELDLLITLARRRGVRPRVGLRANPATQAKTGLRMAGATQFGLSPADLDAALDQLARAADAVDFVGLHLHIGSQILEVATAIEIFRAALETSRDVARRTGKPLRKLNFGGGWGVTYFADQQPLDLAATCAGLRDLVAQREFTDAIAGARLIVEPGRYLVAESGVYATRVLYRKESAGKQFAIVDGGMHHNYLLAGGMGQVIRRNFMLDVLPGDARTKAASVPTVLNIAGCLCTPQDLLAQGVTRAEDVQPGDHVVFFNCGAYGASASPLRFLGHPEPAAMLIER
jgi:diaminopimelate decarboxylase